MKAKFTEGAIFSHICTMTFTSMAGLLSLFLVDLVDMYWLSLLGEIELAAAIGYAGSILFFTLSFSIGLSIGCAAVVSHAIGDGNKHVTRELVGNVLLTITITTSLLALLVVSYVSPLLEGLGAQGRAFELAHDYLVIILPSMPLLAIAMACGGVLRALGSAKEAMFLTLLGGFVNAVLDPIFIFAVGWGIEGAAVASVLARVAMVAYGLHKIIVHYALLAMPNWTTLVRDFKNYFATAFPAVLTNLATPIGVAFVTATMAQFGDSAVAGNAILGKLQPLAFAGLFALSASVGPIAGQNLGAKQYDRIMETLTGSIRFITLYSLVACLALALLAKFIVYAFQASGDAEKLILWFCYGLSAMFFFNGITFLTNALFNNLKAAQYATFFNFLRATVFTMPFALLGAKWGGPVGIYVGLFVGATLVAGLGLWVAYRKIDRLQLTANS